MSQSMTWHLGRTVAWTLPRVAPTSDHVVFGSDQPDDPDALVILDYLAECSEQPVRWTAPTAPARSLLGSRARTAVVTARERTPGSIWSYARASLVFHTAGLYTSPEPARRRTVVTVWHGDGPKATHPPQVRGTYMVAGVERFGVRRIGVHGYSRDQLLVTGRPRVDDLFRGAGEAVPPRALEALGLDARPIVWWMPTWRQSADGRPRELARWPAAAGAATLPSLSKYQFIVKPHRLAPSQAWPEGWRVVTDGELRQNDLRLYRLLGGARAVLTDYSSVWSDFLGTTVPIGFILDDLSQYSTDRGFYEDDWIDRLPGPVLNSAEDLEQLVHEGWTDWHAEVRARVVGQLGAVNGPGATARLFSALDEREVMWR